MQLVVTGHRGAFEQLLERHLDPIHAYAKRITGSATDADDIAQDVFLKLWQKPDRYRSGRVKFTTWLHRVAHNACMDLFRGRNHQALPAEEAEIQINETPDIERAISALPLNQRTAVALCLLGGHSTRDASRIMRSSPRAVESLISRARRTLRQVLQP